MTTEELYRAAQAAKYGDAPVRAARGLRHGPPALMRDRYTLEEVRAMRRQTCAYSGVSERRQLTLLRDLAIKDQASRSPRIRAVAAAFLAWYEAELAECDRAAA